MGRATKEGHAIRALIQLGDREEATTRLLAVLVEHGGHSGRAAEALGVGRTTVWLWRTQVGLGVQAVQRAVAEGVG